MSSSDKKTACLSFQGNGVYFSSNLGALISLLENNYEPVFATGGSSGAILASVSRALVENPSLQGVDGTFAPKLGAVLLAASAPVIESVLFLPRFTTPLSLLDSFDVFLSGSAVGVLRADPNDSLVHAESIVGQATLVVDFFRTGDFSKLIKEPSLAERERVVVSLWKNFANAIVVSPLDFADAVFVPREHLVAGGRSRVVEIQDRFFKMYRSKQDTLLTDYKTRQDEWNQFISGNFMVFGLDSADRRRGLLKKIIENIKTVESFDSLAATLSGDFLLADPDRVYRAFDGYDSRNGKQIAIPSNVVIHTTARRGVRKSGDWKENSGLESLHQVYLTNAAQSENAANVLLEAGNNPLQPSDAQKLPVIPSERLVVTSLELGPALAATTGEPTAFARFPLKLDTPARARLNWTSSNEQLIGFGGWLEKVSLGTATKFPQCASEKVDLYIYTSDGDGVSRFAKMVFLGLFLDTPLRGFLAKQIEDPSVDMSAALSGVTSSESPYSPSADRQAIFKNIINSADSVLAETSNAKARSGHLPIKFDDLNPSKVVGNAGTAINIVFRSNRRAMILAGYEFTRKIANERGIASAALQMWNKRLDSILNQSTPEDVLAVVRDTMPRLSITEGSLH